MKIQPRIQTLPATDVTVIDKILSTLKAGKSFCLTGHQNPDADVIGSQLAMQALLKHINPSNKIDIQNCGPVPRSISFLPGIEAVKNVEKVSGNYDVLIVFECSGADRTGNIIDFQNQVKTVINIDHHLHNPNFGHINFVEPTTSSTAELIFKIYERSGYSMGIDEAVCLYTGLVADTGWFRYSNTNRQTMTIGSKLVEMGVPVATLAERFYMSRSKAGVALISWALGHVKLHLSDRVAIIAIPDKVMTELQATSDDLEELVNQGLQIGSVQASVLLREKTNPTHIKISLRSKGEYDINQIARTFDGGGHKNASGCRINSDLESAEKAILKEMPRVFSE